MSQRERITRYLLGQLTEDECEQTEQDYFVDAAFLSEVQAVCGELIEDYLHQRMSPSDRAAFTQRLHALPFLREHLATERALLLWAEATPPVLPKRRTTAVSSGSSLWAFAWWLPRVATALLVTGMLGVGTWYVVGHNTDEATARFTMPAKPSASPQSEPTPTPTIVPTASSRPRLLGVPAPPTAPRERATAAAPLLASLLLSADTLRSATDLPTLSLPNGKGRVRLQLEVPPKPSSSYRALLRTSAQLPLKTWPRVWPQRYQMDWIVTLLLPARLLQPEEYVIELQGPTTTTYRFRVQPQ